MNTVTPFHAAGRARRFRPWNLFLAGKGLAQDLQFLLPAPRTHEQRKREGCEGPRALRRRCGVGHDEKPPAEYGGAAKVATTVHATFAWRKRCERGPPWQPEH